MKHKTCIGCHAHCIEFPHSYQHVRGRAFCTLGFNVRSASIDSEYPSEEEAIPLDECPKPLMGDFDGFKKAAKEIEKRKNEEKEVRIKRWTKAIKG